MTAETQFNQIASDTDQLGGVKISHKIDWLLIPLIGLLFQAFWAWQLAQPTYMDAFYYATNGGRLVEGHGFSELIIWQYLDDPGGLPTPSHTYWMPLASMLAAVGYLLRDDFTGTQLVFWLLGGLLPLLTYAISWRLTGQRWQAWAAAMFTAAGGYYAAFMSQPTTFAPFAWAGGVCLFALGLAVAPVPAEEEPGAGERTKTHSRRKLWWLLAGIAAGLAHLTRADGSLLLIVALAIWLIDIWNSWKRQKDLEVDGSLGQETPSRSKAALSHLAILILGYLLMMGWWLIRNWIVLGRPLPTAGVQSIFLTTYDDLFAYGRVNDLQHFLDWGWPNIIRSRIQGSWLALQTFIAIPGLIFLVPFIIVGFVHHFRQTTTRKFLLPPFLYAIFLFISSALVFTFPGMRGSLFHSSVALWPFSTALAAAGIGLAVDWVAARLSHWQPEKAKKIFSGLFIVVALILTLFVSQFRLSPSEDTEIYQEVGQIVPPSSVVMAGNAPALYYFTGLPAVSVPNEPVEVLLRAADRYGVTHLLLNENRPQPLDPIYQGDRQHPRVRLIWSSDLVRLFEIVPPSE